ncbi:unnamed protein product, partial [Rotaria magnacalcarata]
SGLLFDFVPLSSSSSSFPYITSFVAAVSGCWIDNVLIL